jgi:hypothetical protein
MPFGSKKGKTAASNNKQLCLGLPDILIAAVARHYGLQEREAAAGIDDDGGAAGEPARVNQHDAQATAARDAALLEATEECIAYLGANPSFVDRVTNRLRLNATLSDKIIALQQEVEAQRARAQDPKHVAAPNYALMLAVVLVIKMQRQIDDLLHSAATSAVVAASPEHAGGALSATTPLNAVGVTPETVERREAAFENYATNRRRVAFGVVSVSLAAAQGQV